MKVGLTVLVVLGAAAALVVLRPPLRDEKARLEEMHWLASAEWHRQNPAKHRDDCDFSTCIRKHMQEHAKAVADWNTPEAKKRREEQRAMLDAEQEQGLDRRHAKLFKHPRGKECDFSTIGRCKELDDKWIEQKLIEERDRK